MTKLNTSTKKVVLPTSPAEKVILGNTAQLYNMIENRSGTIAEKGIEILAITALLRKAGQSQKQVSDKLTLYGYTNRGRHDNWKACAIIASYPLPDMTTTPTEKVKHLVEKLITDVKPWLAMTGGKLSVYHIVQTINNGHDSPFEAAVTDNLIQCATAKSIRDMVPAKYHNQKFNANLAVVENFKDKANDAAKTQNAVKLGVRIKQVNAAMKELESAHSAAQLELITEYDQPQIIAVVAAIGEVTQIATLEKLAIDIKNRLDAVTRMLEDAPETSDAPENRDSVNSGHKTTDATAAALAA